DAVDTVVNALGQVCLDSCRNNGRNPRPRINKVGWCWGSSYDAGVLPASFDVVVSCEPPLRLTTLQAAAYPSWLSPRVSVRRASGFVLVGISDKCLISSLFESVQ